MGHDNKVRTVKIKQGNGALEYHSICNLYPLEVSVTHGGKDAIVKNDVVEKDSSKAQTQVPSRPKRKATQRFERMLRDNLDNL